MAAVCASLAFGVGSAAAQPPAAGSLLDALSITVQLDSATVARGSMRFRQIRTASDVELVASGIVVRRGQRVTAELRTDSLLGLRRYQAETRDSSGRVIDRIVVTSAGGRVTLERVTPERRMIREYVSQRDLVILDSASIVPYVALAGTASGDSVLRFLDVRRGTLSSGQLVRGEAVELSVAEVVVTGTPVTVVGLASEITWWRDGRGRLLRLIWAAGTGCSATTRRRDRIDTGCVTTQLKLYPDRARMLHGPIHPHLANVDERTVPWPRRRAVLSFGCRRAGCAGACDAHGRAGRRARPGEQSPAAAVAQRTPLRRGGDAVRQRPAAAQPELERRRVVA
ncbi:MAG: hypothetical protein U5K74_10250 [Gemmatimonadaceae bacterium]|nr:hypothetical protein [Gemmatimonadaceae bacterium]